MAKDPNGDKIRFDIPGPPDDARLWRNESSITMEWLVTTKSVKYTHMFEFLIFLRRLILLMQSFENDKDFS